MPIWSVGENRYKIRVGDQIWSGPPYIVTEEDLRRVGAGFQDDRVTLRVPSVPVTVDGCVDPDQLPWAFCVDADGDYLLDAWENIAMYMARPQLEFDENEDGLESFNVDIGGDRRWNSFIGSSYARVHTVLPQDTSELRISYRIAWSRDYGPGGHPGDVSFLGYKFTSITGEAEATRLVSLHTRGHVRGFQAPRPFGANANLQTKPEAAVFVDQFNTYKLFIEGPRFKDGGKHGSWAFPCASADMIENVYDCTANDVSQQKLETMFRLRLPVLNMGEPLPDDPELPNRKSMVTDITDRLGEYAEILGNHRQYRDLYPGARPLFHDLSRSVRHPALAGVRPQQDLAAERVYWVAGPGFFGEYLWNQSRWQTFDGKGRFCGGQGECKADPLVGEGSPSILAVGPSGLSSYESDYVCEIGSYGVEIRDAKDNLIRIDCRVGRYCRKPSDHPEALCP
ncbi:MAG: hypothetical protein D6761_10215 [Candidatus Dadabacteria bacterium]|nr:MAG: hypothetical protein D6761_10215 [Candidatus Dadabacteria bacterium]